MTAPVSGPFTYAYDYYGLPQWNNHAYRPVEARVNRTWYRQANPFDLPMKFYSERKKCFSQYESSGPYGTFSGSDPAFVLSDIAFQYVTSDHINGSYSRLVSKVGAAVQGGVATAEGRQACSMIVTRLGQMASFTRNIYRGRFGLAAGALGLDWTQRSVRRKIHTPLPPPRLLREPKYLARESVRSLSKIYLEFHFGWSPLVHDIYDALKVIDAPIKNCAVKGSYTTRPQDPGNSFTQSSDAWYNYSVLHQVSHKVSLTQRAEIAVSNPNLATLQQWGVANPLSIAWELVPFSFVLDWFVSVGDYFNSLTDFAGLTLINPHRTEFSSYAGNRSKTDMPKNPATFNYARGSGAYEGHRCYRQLGLQGPVIALKPAKPWGYRRGLAASSLLMQAYPKRVVSASALHLARKRTQFRENTFPQFNGKYW